MNSIKTTLKHNGVSNDTGWPKLSSVFKRKKFTHITGAEFIKGYFGGRINRVSMVINAAFWDDLSGISSKSFARIF